MSADATAGLVPLNFTFATAIRQHLVNEGITATPEEIAAIDSEMRELGSHDPATGQFSFILRTGQDGNVLEYLEQATARLPKAAKPDPALAATSVSKNGWTKVQIGSSTSWRRADDPLLKILTHIEASQ
ncbi:hypothetical protein ASF56_24745 [Methylobacterium sp. Leaf122]|nr:hypothetical protein [Methylobacterium sp. Leaf122]KQQ11532.1 hypothetical protein ASF56_24745 [Methylobacterium sp. Leaf122]